MEAYPFKTLLYFSSALLLILYFVMRILYKLWLKPIHLERILRQQGIRGTPYKLFHGDMGELRRSTVEALSQPMSLNHRVVPRVAPFYYDMVQKYGNNMQ